VKGTRKSGWALCITALVAVLSVPLRADTPETSKKPIAVPFDEAEMERYRVDIHPTKPDSGIETGFVVAYGYYLEPPYAPTVEAGTLRVNGVQVYPPIPRAPKSFANYPKTRGFEIEMHLERVGEVAFDAFLKKDTTAAFAVFDSIVKNDTLVESIRVGNQELAIYGPDGGEGPGGIKVAWSLEQSSEQPPRTFAEKVPTPTQLALGELAWLAHALGRGAGVLVTPFGIAGPLGLDYLKQAAEIMTTPDLEAKQVWLAAATLTPTTASYSLAASYPAATTGWWSARQRTREDQ
jgi:hypothetical protein